jgi:hypothetical protein
MKLKKNIALSDSGFLFNPSTGDSFSINPIGNFVIRLMQEGKEDAQIIQEVLKEYMIDRDTVEKDLYDFQNMLNASKLNE